MLLEGLLRSNKCKAIPHTIYVELFQKTVDLRTQGEMYLFQDTFCEANCIHSCP